MQYLGLLIPIVALVAVFTFVSVAAWAENRRKEREAFHKHETYRRILEQSGQGAETVLSLMRDEEIREARARIEGLKLGGMITAVVGVAVGIFLEGIEPGKRYWAVGLIPLLIGVVLAGYAFFLAPSPGREGGPR